MKSERPTRPSRVAPETAAGSGADDALRRGRANALAGITPGRFAALLALLILACFPQVVLGLETFYYVDYGQFGLPLAVHHRESFWRGEVPLWNPLNNCGIPFLAQWNTMTLYPLSLIYLLLPLPWSLAVFCLGHLLLAAVGMYCLALRWTRHRLAAAVAGVAFAFNGVTWYGLMWPNNLAGLAWMPWVILLAERAWSSGRRRIPFAAVVAAMQLLTGAPEVCLLTWLSLAVLWVATWVRTPSARADLVRRAPGIGLAAAGLAAIQLLPFLNLLAHSQRGSDYGTSAVGALAAMPLTGWANYLVPLFRCVRDSHGIYHQADQPWLGSYYVGVGVVALALLAAWRARDQRIRLWIGLTLLSLVLALGSSGLVYDWLHRVAPVFGFMRYPIKFVMLATFSLPLLAAFGMSWMQRVPAERWPGERSRIRRLTLLLVGLMGVIVAVAWIHPANPAQRAATVVNAGLRALFLVAVVGTCVLLRRTPDQKTQLLLQIGLVILLWFDVFTHTPELSPTVPTSVLKPGAIRRYFGWNETWSEEGSRACQSRASFWQMLAPQAPEPEQEITARRMSLSMNFNLLDRVAKFDGFYSLDVKEFLDVFQQVYFTTNNVRPLQDFLAVSLVSNPTNPVEWVTRDTFLPLLTAGQQPSYVASGESLAAVTRSDFEPRREVFLPLESHGEIRVSGPVPATVSHPRLAAHRLEADVNAGAPTLLVVAQTFYPGWQARVDGNLTPLYRANHAFQALQVPAGRHRISLVYRDPLFLWGTVISGASLLVCAVLRRRAFDQPQRFRRDPPMDTDGRR